MAIVEAFATIKHNAKLMIVIGKKREINVGACMSMDRYITKTPKNVMYIPARIMDLRAYILENLAAIREPITIPIGGKIFATPYSALLMPKILIAINGAKAA